MDKQNGNMEMPTEIGSKRKHSDAEDATRGSTDAPASVGAVGESASALVASAPRKKPREEPLPSDGHRPVEAEEPTENGQQERQQERGDDEEDPAWVLMRALEREIEESATTASLPLTAAAAAIPEDDDYDESDDDN